MTETIIPAFKDAPEEGKIVSRLLAGYGELELEMCECTHRVNNDLNAAIKSLFGKRGERARIATAENLTNAPYAAVGLGAQYITTMADMDWCRSIRNQYAHCHWYYTSHEGLCFINLEELAKQPAKIIALTNAKLPVDVKLLSQQEAFFKYVQKCFWYLQEQYSILTGAAPRRSIPLWPKPPPMAQPVAHN